MIYKNIRKGVFVSRPNRFIAKVDIGGITETVHVKNTGRCKELLVPGAPVYLEEHDSASRKTKYSLIGVEKNNRMVNIDSQAPNKVFHEFVKEGNLFSNIKLIKPEFTYGNSRFDFYLEEGELKFLIEVKGATLEENNIARFPDAPTERGLKHIYELARSIDEGFIPYIVFIIQMNGIEYFTPNTKTHPEFSAALKYAEKRGVSILAYDCDTGSNYLKICNKIKVVL